MNKQAFVRGGSWHGGATFLFRCASRRGFLPYLRDGFRGFRVVMREEKLEIRGGSWYSGLPDLFQCTYRLDDEPDERFDFRGFRVVLNDDTP